MQCELIENVHIEISHVLQHYAFSEKRRYCGMSPGNSSPLYLLIVHVDFQVVVRDLGLVEPCNRVAVEPFSVDDWEILVSGYSLLMDTPQRLLGELVVSLLYIETCLSNSYKGWQPPLFDRW